MVPCFFRLPFSRTPACDSLVIVIDGQLRNIMCQAVSHGQLCALDLACYIPHGDEIRVAVVFCRFSSFPSRRGPHAGELSERMLIAPSTYATALLPTPAYSGSSHGFSARIRCSQSQEEGSGAAVLCTAFRSGAAKYVPIVSRSNGSSILPPPRKASASSRRSNPL